MGRYPPPGYEEDPNASPAYDEERDAPEYEDQRYVSEDPYAQRHEETQETDQSLAAMHQRELDAQRQGDDRREEEGEEGEHDASESWLGEDADPEDVRRQNAERESGYERERREADEAYRMDEREERGEREDDEDVEDEDEDEDSSRAFRR